MMTWLSYLCGLFLPFFSFSYFEYSILLNTPIQSNVPSFLVAFFMLIVAMLSRRRILHLMSMKINFIVFVFIAYISGVVIYLVCYTQYDEFMPSVFSFTLTPFFLYVIPLLSFRVMQQNPYSMVSFVRGILLSSIFVFLLICVQFNSLLGYFSVISDLYSNFLFRIFESRWGGWEGGLNQAFDYPLVKYQLRPSATFPEPSVLASYLSIVILPLVVSSFICPGVIMSKKASVLYMLMCIISLLLTFSTTAYISIACLFSLFILKVHRFKSSRIFLSLIVAFCFSMMLLWFFSDEVGVVVFNSISLQTRLGGMVASVSQLFDMPLGSGFHYSNINLGNYVPFWARNVEFYEQADNHWFVFTSFILQLISTYGVFSVFLFFIPAYFFLSRVDAIDKGYDRVYRSVFVYFLMVSICSAVTYQAFWFVFIVVFGLNSSLKHAVMTH